LLPRNFLIVEGKSEFEFLGAVVRRFFANECRGIKATLIKFEPGTLPATLIA
jgi:hypothetical protein